MYKICRNDHDTLFKVLPIALKLNVKSEVIRQDFRKISLTSNISIGQLSMLD